MRSATVVVCAEIEDPDWRWVEGSFAGKGVQFEFARCIPRIKLAGATIFNLARLRGSLHAVKMARRLGASAIVTHGPTLAAWSALFARAVGLKIPILAHSFNFTSLPRFPKRIVFALALKSVDRFVVFSTVERELYAATFGLPIDRFDVVLWGVRQPKVDTPTVPLEPGPYVSAIGGNARDYRTLLEVARKLPDIRFVLVVRPTSLKGLALSSNITVRTNLPYGKTMNVLMHSRFMVLPLINSQVPCGHVTLVAAMHLGKAFVITDSSGVNDYVRDGGNALTVLPASVEGLAGAVQRLWKDSELCARLGENGRHFAARECTEERIAEHFRGWLRRHGLGDGGRTCGRTQV